MCRCLFNYFMDPRLRPTVGSSGMYIIFRENTPVPGQSRSGHITLNADGHGNASTVDASQFLCYGHAVAEVQSQTSVFYRHQTTPNDCLLQLHFHLFLLSYSAVITLYCQIKASLMYGIFLKRFPVRINEVTPQGLGEHGEVIIITTSKVIYYFYTIAFYHVEVIKERKFSSSFFFFLHILQKEWFKTGRLRKANNAVCCSIL